jgi:hypothetical protein
MKPNPFSFNNEWFSSSLLDAMLDENHSTFNHLLKGWYDIFDDKRDQNQPEIAAIERYIHEHIIEPWSECGSLGFDAKMVFKLLSISNFDMNIIADMLIHDELEWIEPIKLWVEYSPNFFSMHYGERHRLIKALLKYDGIDEILNRQVHKAIEADPNGKKGINIKKYLLNAFQIMTKEPDYYKSITKGVDINVFDEQVSAAINVIGGGRYPFDDALIAYHMDMKKTSKLILNGLVGNFTGIQTLIAKQKMDYVVSDERLFDMRKNSNIYIKRASFNHAFFTEGFSMLGAEAFEKMFSDSLEFIKHIKETLDKMDGLSISYDPGNVARNIDTFFQYIDEFNKGNRFWICSDDSNVKSIVAMLPEKIRNHSSSLKRKALEEDFGL